MVHQPRRKEEIKEDIRSNLEDEIPGLTNFLDTSFNDTWITAFAEKWQELEAKTLAAQFSHWVDFAGNSSLTRDDLEGIGVDFSGWDDDEVDDFIEQMNGLSESVHLDQMGKLVGVERGEGQKASGTVTITTASSTVSVPEGLEVATEPDSNGNYLSYYADVDDDGEISGTATVTPGTGNTTVDVSVIADEVGDEYNVGSGSITFLPSPPPGIESVSNGTETSGGVNEQSNDDFRDELSGSVITESGGGTAAGVEGSVGGVENVNDVEIDEFPGQDPPYVDVIVDGGSDGPLLDEIASSKPTGVKHNLVRPENINLAYRLELVGASIDTARVEDNVNDYIRDLGIGDGFRRSRTIQRILNSDRDIDDIGSLTVLIVDTINESETYSTGSDIYDLDFEPALFVEGERRLYRSSIDVYRTAYSNVLDNSSVEVTAIVDGDETELTKGADYTVVDDSQNGDNDAIDLSAGSVTPDDRTVFEVEYEVHNDEFSTPVVTGTLNGTSDHEFTAQTDYDIIDSTGTSVLSSPGNAGNPDRIDWSVGGDSPDDGTRFYMDYDVQRVILDDEYISVREKFSLDTGSTAITTIEPQ